MLDCLVHSRIPLLADVDVLIIGAGSAGCCAAIAARIGGAKNVMLVERYGFLGGTSTGVLDTFYGFFTPGDQPKKIVGGLPDRVVDALHDSQAMYLRPNTYGAGTGITYSPERLKLIWDHLIFTHGVRPLLHATLIDVEHTRDNINSCILSTRGGLFRVTARRFIDCSGDADLCNLAGIEYEKAGEIDPAQTLTTTFRLTNVDFAQFESAGGKKMLAEKMTAVDLQKYPLPRRKGSFHAMAIPGCASTVAARIADLDPTDPQQLTEAELTGRRQAFEYERFVRDCIPGYAAARICGLSVQIGIRETRRVFGEYRLTRQDCMNLARFDDCIFLCGAPIEDHRATKPGEDETAWAYLPGNGAYDVPYRCLVPRGRDDIWVAGRCFSATHDAHASCRSMAQTMAIGQAAGLAAAISLQTNCSARNVPIAELQSQLSKLGAVLQMPEGIAQTAADAWNFNRN